MPQAARWSMRAGRPSATAAARDAAPLVALAASGPLLWCLHDLLITGNALHSLTGTRDNAALLGRVTGLQNVPETLPRRIGEILREPVLLAAAGGGVLALVLHRDRRTRLAAAAGAISVAAFCVLAAAGLPIITRYVLLTGTLLAIFAGGRGLRLARPAARRAPHVVGALRRAGARRAARLRPEPGAADRQPRRRPRAGRSRSRPTSRGSWTTASRAGRSRCPIAARSRCSPCG